MLLTAPTAFVTPEVPNRTGSSAPGASVVSQFPPVDQLVSINDEPLHVVTAAKDGLPAKRKISADRVKRNWEYLRLFIVTSVIGGGWGERLLVRCVETFHTLRPAAGSGLVTHALRLNSCQTDYASGNHGRTERQISIALYFLV